MLLLSLSTLKWLAKLDVNTLLFASVLKALLNGFLLKACALAGCFRCFMPLRPRPIPYLVYLSMVALLLLA